MLRYRYRNTKKKRPVTNLCNKMRRSIRQYERLEVGESMKSLVNIISKDLILSLFTEHHSGTVGNWVDLHSNHYDLDTQVPVLTERLLTMIHRF